VAVATSKRRRRRKRRRKDRGQEEVRNRTYTYVHRSAGERRRARMVGGGLTESGVRATCFGGFTIVYRHRSTEWPVPYTDSHTPRAHEVR